MSAGLKLLSPLSHRSGLTFKNRIALAPLTRGRSGHERIPNDLNLQYYKQRATAGLVITEATTVSEIANGWAQSPGIYTQEMCDGWKKVVDAVHQEGGVIFCQFWFIGRASHSSFMPNNAQIVAPSAIKIEGDGVRDINDVKHDHETPRALATDEIPAIVESYRKAAEFAKQAGFDGVEVHGANGYLLDQFLQSCSNKRDDQYGGSVENRFRLLREVVEAVSSVMSSERVGVRLSPNGAYNGMGSADNIETFTFALQQLDKMNLAYAHVMDGLGFGFHKLTEPFTLSRARSLYSGTIIGNVGYTKESAEEAIQSGNADLVAFGRPYLANPDLPARFQNGWPLAEAPLDVWFSHDAKGYADFPTYQEEQERLAKV